jgi:adenine phosphoribosyltransferase
MDLKQYIRNIPDFPKPGILFYDISPLLADASAWRETMDRMVEAIRPYQPDLLAGMESRGFLPAAPLAMALGLGVQPGQRIVVLDDLLATGGTMNAAVSLLRKVGGEVVATSVIIELGFLGGAERLDVPVHSVIRYDE